MARKYLWGAPLVFLAVMFYYPLARILILGFSNGFLNVLASDKIAGVIWFTIWQALLTTVITVTLGVVGAYVLYRRSFPGQRFVQALITVPFMLPTIVVAVGFTVFRSAHSIYESIGLGFFTHPIYWIIAAHVFVNFSIAVKTIGGVWSSLDSEIEEAAELDGASRLRTALTISLPQLRPALFSAGALIFLFSVTSFGIVLVLGGGKIQTIETAIYYQAAEFLDLKTASVLVVVQTVITATAFLLGNYLAKGSIGIEGVFEQERSKPLDRRDLPATLITAVVVIGLIVMPMLLVVVEAFNFQGSFSLQNFANLAGQGTRDLLNISFFQAGLNSLRNMAVAASIAFLIGTLVSWLLTKTKAALLDLAFLLPLGVSSVVLGLGFLIAFDAAWFPLRSSWLAVPIAQSLIALPLVIRLVYPALVAIGPTAREQAAVDGATSWQLFWFIEAGMIRPILLTALSYAAIVSLGEFGAANFLAYGSQGTVPTLLYRLISRPGGENYSMAMAVSTILIAVSFLVVFAVSSQLRTRRQQAAA